MAILRAGLAALLCAVAACNKEHAEAPLPPPKFEVAPAPPGALGAKAAGTDAAPQPPEEEPNLWPSEGEEAAPGHGADGKSRDAGPAAPQPDAGGLPL